MMARLQILGPVNLEMICIICSQHTESTTIQPGGGRLDLALEMDSSGHEVEKLVDRLKSSGVNVPSSMS